jgi:hypothetical protein
MTSTEIASLWTQYMNETIDICVKEYVLQQVEDAEIRSIFERTKEISKNHVEQIKGFFNKENCPIPIGFTNADVDLKAPRLYSDEFWLFYLHTMSTHGLTGYALALQTSTRLDIRDYYVHCNIESMDIYNTTLNILLSKGLFQRPPYIPPADSAELVKHQNFLAGWLGDVRPLNAIEISHISYNLNKSIMANCLLLGFNQTAKSKHVREFISRVVDGVSKHIETFRKTLHDDNLPSPMSWETAVTKSTVAPFSDKLIMFHGVLLTNLAIAYYGAALSTSMRRDLGALYSSAIAKGLTLAEDGANIMIDNGWMEQPPTAVNREDLTKV